MNRQQGPGQPLRNMTNIGATQSRNPTPGSRLVSTKSGAWGSNLSTTPQPVSQSHESNSSWAQAMNPRSTNPIDLSSSSFPSLAGGGGNAHNPGSSLSQWQAGPPAREHTQPPSNRTIQQRQPTLSAQREQSHSNDFSSLEQQPGRYPPQSQLTRGAPPGLAPVDGMPLDGGPSNTQSRRSPILQAMNGSIGQERTNGDNVSPSSASVIPSSNKPKESFLPREQLSPISQQDQSLDTIFKGLSERDKWGMAGWQALHDGPAAEYKAVSRGQDAASFEHHANLGQSLLRTYPGPFAGPNAYPPRPLDSDFQIPDCYIVQNVAPIQQRISGFTEDTLFYIFYTSPKDIIQEEVATELMSRKWRFHMKEKMWLTRDDATSNPVIIEKDVCEQGYYIWWDYRSWKRVRKMYILRYEDLDDHTSGGRSLAMPGLFQGGIGMVGGMNGGGTAGNVGFNAVPNLERAVATQSGRF